MYQNKRKRNQCGWVVGHREGAEERFCWKHESKHWEMCRIVIAYIVSSLPNNHVRPPAQFCLCRGQELQDSGSVTVAVSSARGTGPGRISQSPRTLWFPQQRASALRHNRTCSAEKRHFLAFTSKQCPVLMASIKNLSWKKLKPRLCIKTPDTYEIGPFSSVPIVLTWPRAYLFHNSQKSWHIVRNRNSEDRVDPKPTIVKGEVPTDFSPLHQSNSPGALLQADLLPRVVTNSEQKSLNLERSPSFIFAFFLNLEAAAVSVFQYTADCHTAARACSSP